MRLIGNSAAAELGPVDQTSSEGTFVGRRREQDLVARCLEEARAGEARVVWIEGPAGTGKTAFVRQVVRQVAPPSLVLWAEADEVSTESSFSLLEQYLPVRAASPFAAGLRLVDHLAGAGSADGVVVVVADDLHWADPASRLALLTAARRLRHDRVVLLLTSRPGVHLDAWDWFVDTARCVRVVLAGLDDREVAELAAGRGVALGPSEAARLRHHTAGHPLYVNALLAELSPDQLRSTSGDLPAPRSLAAVTIASRAVLPPPARDLADALAVLGTRTSLSTAGRVAGVERPAEALEPLVASGLVTWAPAEEDTPVVFSHPLLRTAVYEHLSPRTRRDLHLASAEVTRGATSWSHRVAACDTADDVLADELEAGARSEIARRQLSAAATYLWWASTVSSSRDQAEERLLLGARLAMIDGQTARAVALSRRIEQCAETALRDLVVGMLRFCQGDAVAAERWLSGVARLPGPDWVHADALGNLAVLHALRGRNDDAIAAAEAALQRRPFEFDDTDISVWCGLAIGLAQERGAPSGLARLHERLDKPASKVSTADAELLAVRGSLRNEAGRTHEAIIDLRASIDMARRGAVIRRLPRVHLALARALYFAGQWDDSLLQARIALSLLDDSRVWMPRVAEGSLVPVLAGRGHFDEAERYATDAWVAADRLGTIELDAVARMATASIARARGDHAAIIEALTPWVEGAGTYGSPYGILSWTPMLLAARIDHGQIDGVEDDIDRFEAAGRKALLDVVVPIAGLRGRLAAALGDAEAAASAYALAVSSLGPDHPVLDRALLQHAYGRLLRARGGRRAARDQLRSAYDLLERIGASPYLAAVAEDLADLGGRKAPAADESPLSLTTREQDVVALVNKGLTNKQVGAELYISDKAVEYHLANVYGKVGVRSRRELRDRVPTS